MEYMRKGVIALILPLVYITLLAGCNVGNNTSPSNVYPANSIYAYMTALQDATGDVTTTVQLRNGPTGSAGYLYLSAGDVLYSSLDTSPQQYLNFNDNLFSNSLELSQHLKVMAARDLFIDYGLFNNIVYGKPEYFVLDTPATGSSPVRAYVGFERSEQLLAGDSSVELPAAFQITAPASEAVISRSTPIALTWSNADPAATVELDVAGICMDDSRFNLHRILGADTGSTTLASANYFPASVNPAMSCRIAFLLQRVRLGGVSAQFAFGSFKGIQQRTVQFTSTP